MNQSICRHSLKITILTLLLCCLPFKAFSQKQDAAEVIKNHLASIGSENDRKAVKNMLVVSDAEVKIKGSASGTSGRALILSSANKTMWAMSFASNAYPMDKFGFNGTETKVGFINPGTRSVLGDFIFSYNEIVREGLLGGTLTTAWALANLDSSKAKIEWGGTADIKGRQHIILKFAPKKGGDIETKMFFDAENYRHTRTEYLRIIEASQGATVDGSAGRGADRYQLIEEFSDFKKAGKLTLPSIYKINYSYSSNAAIQSKQKSNREMEWSFKVTSFSQNQEISDADFIVNIPK